VSIDRAGHVHPRHPNEAPDTLNTSISARSPRAILCDLGGVLISVDFAQAFAAWAPFSELPQSELQATFRFDLQYQRHERGEIDRDEYFAHLRKTLRLHASDAEIAAGWNAILIGEIETTLRLLESARQSVPIYLFSNSNATHKAAWTARFPRVMRICSEVFVSSDLGLRKPERAAFLAVARRIGLPPEAILFLDDTLENVEGARAVGMQAVHVRAATDVADALDAIDRAARGPQ
jgi:putative hydrolase of the HAD superfamily